MPLNAQQERNLSVLTDSLLALNDSEKMLDAIASIVTEVEASDTLGFDFLWYDENYLIPDSLLLMRSIHDPVLEVDRVISGYMLLLYWAWQIYNNEQVSKVQSAYLLVSEKIIFDYKNIGDSTDQMNFNFIKNGEQFELLLPVIAVYKEWFTLVQKYGLAEIQRKGIPPIKEGCKWVKFERGFANYLMWQSTLLQKK